MKYIQNAGEVCYAGGTPRQHKHIHTQQEHLLKRSIRLLIQRVHFFRMLADQDLRIGLFIQIYRIPIVVIPSIRETVESKLPVLRSGNFLLDDGLLPLPDNLDAGEIVHFIKDPLTIFGGQPAVFFQDYGLAEFVLGGGMVFNPLGAPGSGLAPPVGVEMEGAVIDVRECQLAVKVATVGGGVKLVIVAGEVEFTWSQRLDRVGQRR